MTTPTPYAQERTGPGLQEVEGPLVRQSAPAARLALVLNHCAMELWDICTYTDAADMWEEARAIASRILAACPTEKLYRLWPVPCQPQPVVVFPHGPCRSSQPNFCRRRDANPCCRRVAEKAVER